MPFIPHTDADTTEMLQAIGVDNIEDLYSEIPPALRIKQLENIPHGLGEYEVKRLISDKLKNDHLGMCFIGAGSYEHHIPSAVGAILSRGEFLTAYTPYQAEASQGNLQLIYEFQTMIASLMGLEAANASVYDGACALTESILMAIRINKTKARIVLIPRTVHPAYRKVVASIVKQQDIKIIEVDYDQRTGRIQKTALTPYEKLNIAAVVIPQANFFGILEEVDTLTDWAHFEGAIAIGLVNPISVSVLKEPGRWGKEGVDIACGEGQPLGISMASGGPYFGFMACKLKYIRQMPGRIVGQTVDLDGNKGFTLTLQAREQHIRRAKATSNICTNQGLMVTAATIYMSLLGAHGLQQVARASYAGAHNLQKMLMQLEGVSDIFQSMFFHEFVMQLEQPPSLMLKALEQLGIQGGYDLSQDYPELGNALLICVTETKTEEDLLYYTKSFQKSLLNPISLESCVTNI